MIFDKNRCAFLEVEGLVTAGIMHDKIKHLIYKEETLKEALEKIDYYSGPGCTNDGMVLSKEDLSRAVLECILSPGGSEGEYLDCFLKTGKMQIRISCIKTLDEGLDGYLALGKLAGAVTKFGYEFLFMNL